MAKTDYAQMNRSWLAAKSRSEGVLALDGGVYYKVLASGNPEGPCPTPGSIVTVHYSGWTINGKVFDSTNGTVPLACRLRDLIEGWIIALQKMHVGDKWQVYIPAEKGYGKYTQPGIPGGSTLVFDIELIGIA